MSSSDTPDTTTLPAPRSAARRMFDAVIAGVALVLLVAFAPLSLVVAGVFVMAVAIGRRTLPRPARLVLFVVGLAVAVTAGLVLADFTWGSAEPTMAST